MPAVIGLYMADTVTRVRPGPPTQDAYGNDVPGPPTELEVSRVAVLPPTGQAAPSIEQTDGRDQVVVVRVLFAPAGTDLRATDQIRHRGTLYEVHGQPSEYPGPLAHIEANLKAVSG
ncbi:hypothetical protein ACIF6L_26630 [Kitasatospora sp. NPDC086009]|uniref:hypothetical protein n=1 Tax=unclassified Kitasatospora TaxID=2633591 RepID=UPI0037CC1890